MSETWAQMRTRQTADMAALSKKQHDERALFLTREFLIAGFVIEDMAKNTGIKISALGSMIHNYCGGTKRLRKALGEASK